MKAKEAIPSTNSDSISSSFYEKRKVLVTGGSGFIGSAIVKELVKQGAIVRALLEPGGDFANLEGSDVERVECDIRDLEGVTRAVKGAEYVFHSAALYRFWSKDKKAFEEVNVGGTKNVMLAFEKEGCSRLVYTSTVGTLGLSGGKDVPSNEESHVDIDHLFGNYKKTKYVAEHEVLKRASEGLPVVLTQPTMPIGAGDRGPTPSGRLVLDFLNGKMPAYVDTTLNIVDVRDVAAGHLLAGEKGKLGRSYILGGTNLSMAEILGCLSEITGLKAPTIEIPHFVPLGAAYLSEFFQSKIAGKQPFVELEAVKMSGTHMSFDDSRARNELGHSSREATCALASAVDFYLKSGYVKAGQVKKLNLEKLEAALRN